MNARNRSLLYRLGVCAIAVAWLAAAPVTARTLAEVQARGVISLCANPYSLPHSSNQPGAPGFQIEIGRALAQALGFPLQVDWIVARMRAVTREHRLLHADPPRLRPALCPRLRYRTRAALDSRRRLAPQR